MIKSVLTGFGIFVVGLATAFLADSFFRGIIQDLYQWTTNSRIQFGGKDLYLFGNPIYFLSVGSAFLFFFISNRKTRLQGKLKNGIAMLLIFGIALIGISGLDANLKVVECTACDDGIRRLGYNEINYGLIVATSVILSMIPGMIKIIRSWKRPAHNIL